MTRHIRYSTVILQLPVYNILLLHQITSYMCYITQAQPPQVTAVQTLLDHGADVYAKNKETHTAIQCIMMSPLCDVQCLDTLLEFDHNQIGIVDSQGNGLLHYASTPKAGFVYIYIM